MVIKLLYVNLSNKLCQLFMFYSIFIIFPMKQMLNAYYFKVMVMMFNATFNNISVISWRSVIGGRNGRKPRPVATH